MTWTGFGSGSIQKTYIFCCFLMIIHLHGIRTRKPHKENISDFTTLGDWLLFDQFGVKLPSEANDYNVAKEYEGYDGWFNNPSKPDFGAVDTQLLRRVAAAYEDDDSYQPTGQNRPNPLTLSEVFRNESIDIRTQSNTGKNVLLVFFGQQIVKEIMNAERVACPPEYINIRIPDDHPFRNLTHHAEMPVLRTRYDHRSGFGPNNPRQQLNAVTPYIDGGSIYGTSKAWSNSLRLYANGTLAKNGTLASSDDGLWPELNTMGLPMDNLPSPTDHHKFIEDHELFNVRRLFKLGNRRGNENVYLMTFGIVWFRWHNFLANRLKERRANWSDERIFNEARKWVIASQQQIIFYEWLPEFIHHNVSDYDSYKSTIDPQIEQLFQSAAFRFGHTLVPSAVKLKDYKRKECTNEINRTVRTCNLYWPNEALINEYKNESQFGIDQLILGMAYQPSEREDSTLVEDLRGNVYGPLEFSRRDLMALNIQRGRDHGLPNYKAAREAYNLNTTTCKKYNSIKDEYKNTLQRKTNTSWSSDDIDVWIGGLLESNQWAYGPGDLFTAIILDQFERIRDGDRFWFENTQNGLFAKHEIKRLKDLRFYDILMAVTSFQHNDLPSRVFGLEMKTTMDDKDCSSTKLYLPYSCTIHPRFTNFLNKTHNIDLNVSDKNMKCYYEDIANNNLSGFEMCAKFGTYDYLTNSEHSLLITFGTLIAFIIGVFVLIVCLLQYERIQATKCKRKLQKEYFKKLLASNDTKYKPFQALEWTDFKKRMRNVIVQLYEKSGEIRLLNPEHGGLLRRIVLKKSDQERVTIDFMADQLHLGLRIRNEYDLLLQFTPYWRQRFDEELESFLFELNVQRDRNTTVPLRTFFKSITTKRQRQQQLEQFFRAVFSHMFQIEKELKMPKEAAHNVIHTELTLTEFADQLTIGSESEFAKKMFQLMDNNKKGFITFQEFLTIFMIFSQGKATDKMDHLFRMYDMNDTGILPKDEFINLVRSLLDVLKPLKSDKNSETIVRNIMLEAGFYNKSSMNLIDFRKLLETDPNKLGFDFNQLDFSTKALSSNSRMREVKETLDSLYADLDEIKCHVRDEQDKKEIETMSKFQIVRKLVKVNLFYKIRHWLKIRFTQIFWFTMFTVILWSIFLERFYQFCFEREHCGLRRTLGYSIAVTQGAASAQMFCFGIMLVMMCRHSITLLRETYLCHYIPFDSNVALHTYAGCWALFFTVIHCVGHAFNYYHISRQPTDDLTCLFPNTFHASHEIPKFNDWFWQTLPGVTGVLLLGMTTVMYAFTIPAIRHRFCNAFWFTHELYPIFFILLSAHGSSRFIQEPLFWYYFLVPGTMFLIDHGYGQSTKRIKINITSAELLLSDVTMLKFKKPSGFSYDSGQWIRIACLRHNPNEYHAFTLTSHPHDPYLTVHIRAVSRWTHHIQKVYNRSKPYPKIYLEGPFGRGHRNWDQFNVSILIGGGIGVTPFASILKDIVHKNYKYSHSTCPNIKVYFIWVTRTQKQFEWMVDIMRDVEIKDSYHLISMYLFITQSSYKRYDLRTVMLYFFERHFQKTSNRSLFTGLKAVTHFGRPNFHQFFQAIQTLHPDCQKIGVFTCGPPPMTESAQQACANMNSETVEGPMFVHHFRNLKVTD